MSAELEALYEQIRGCEACGLCKERMQAVPGEGPPNARIMFVGEGPGFHEDQQGRPFVGQAGKFLEAMLASIGMTRQDVYIANVVKCRPPGNRDPLPTEVDSCRPYLLSQIDLIDPDLIVTLGRFSLSWFFPKDAISKVRGRLRQFNGRHFYHIYHPAAALHNGSLRSVIEEDFSRIPAALDRIREHEPVLAAVTTSAEQGRLF
ncbi:MAG TPA: uracil-DNA glycosylase [Dehalococcoidia bacterium]|nr:uracil-DNA glycosylase [Dehalococcoidia bacterium]